MVDLNDKGSESEDMVKSPDRGSSSSSDNNNGGVVRTCVDCGTTKTPLWRGGPAGPKSVCNACGIRNRKKRRALLGLAPVEKKSKKIVAATDGAINPARSVLDKKPKKIAATTTTVIKILGTPVATIANTTMANAIAPATNASTTTGNAIATTAAKATVEAASSATAATSSIIDQGNLGDSMKRKLVAFGSEVTLQRSRSCMGKQRTPVATNTNTVTVDATAPATNASTTSDNATTTMAAKASIEAASSATAAATSTIDQSNLGDSIKRKLVEFGREVALQRPRSSMGKPRRKLGEEEQAALLLMAMSCGSVFA